MIRERDTASRVLAITAELLISKGYSAASIAEIAERARCSTATIYDMFETKERLFREALLDLQQRESPPVLDADGPDDQALAAILDYAAARIGFLSSTRLRGMLLASLLWVEQSREGVRTLFRELDQAARLNEAVAAAMRAGQIRAHGDADATGYCLLAAMSFEPMMMNLHRFEQVDMLALIGTAFSPFLTRSGEAAARDWMEARGAAADTIARTRWTYLDAID